MTRGKGDSLTVELFDIQSDPSEQHDLSDAQPDRVKELLLKFEKAAAADQDSIPQVTPQNDSLITAITKQTLWTNRDGESRTWFHPRACMVPDEDGKPVALMTLQEIGGSDYFGASALVDIEGLGTRRGASRNRFKPSVASRSEVATTG